MTKNNICDTGCGCAGAKPADVLTNSATEKFVAIENPKQTIEIDFLYLDLEVCGMCRGTETNLEEALADVSALLEKTGVRVVLNKIHVESYEQALALGFISSPTIRVNGRDVALEVRENYCSSCSALSGTETFCRVWNFQGEEFSTVPKFMVVEAILKEIYGGRSEAAEISPARKARSLENLQRFFAGAGENKAAENAAPAKSFEAAAAASKTGCGCA